MTEAHNINQHIESRLILIKHHALDAIKSLEGLTGDKDIILSSLNDIVEEVEGISQVLPKAEKQEVEEVKETTHVMREKVKDIFKT